MDTILYVRRISRYLEREYFGRFRRRTTSVKNKRSGLSLFSFSVLILFYFRFIFVFLEPRIKVRVTIIHTVTSVTSDGITVTSHET